MSALPVTGHKRAIDDISPSSWAKIEVSGQTTRYVFCNGTVVTDSPKQEFARFTSNTPVLHPTIHNSSPVEIQKLLKEIQTVGFSAIRIMSNEDAETCYRSMCTEYRTLLKEHAVTHSIQSPDVDIDSVTLMDLSKSMYSGRAGSGKLNANGFNNCASVWDVRKKTAVVMEKIFGEAFGKQTSVMSTNGLVFSWGPNLVDSLPQEESLARAFPHLDYTEPLGTENPMLKPGIQSIVVVASDQPNEKETTATMVFPGSHHHYEEICQRAALLPKPKKGGLPWELLVDMVNEGKLEPPVRVTVPAGCALVWSRILAHSPDSTREGKRVALREAPMPTEQISLRNRIHNVLYFLTHSTTGGVEVNGNIRVLSLYNRRGSTIWRNLGWSIPPGVDPKFFTTVKEKTGKEYHNVGVGELKKIFTPYELTQQITDPEMAHILGIDSKGDLKKLESLSWKELK